MVRKLFLLAFCVAGRPEWCLSDPVFWMLCGDYSYQIPFTVNGTSNKSVKWTLVAGPGSVSSNGVYKPPRAPEVVASVGPGVDFGTTFNVDANGYVQSIRFFKNPGDSGGHTGYLWRCTTSACNAGTQLAHVSFEHETSSGWQEQNLPRAILVSSGIFYKVTVHYTRGNWEGALMFFSRSGIDSGHLHAAVDHKNGPTGTYNYNSKGGVFPTSDYHGTNFWADVVYSNAATGGVRESLFSDFKPIACSSFAEGTEPCVTLRVASVADDNATAILRIGLLPPGESPPGSIRIDSGQGNYTTDAKGNLWEPETALDLGIQGGFGSGNIVIGNEPDTVVYTTKAYTSGSVDDDSYRFIVPNGNYKIRAMYSEPASGKVATPIPAYNYGDANYLVEAQGQVVWHNWHVFRDSEPAGHSQLYGAPVYIYAPAKVTDNVLQFNSRSVFSDGDVVLGGNANCFSCREPDISGLEITSDSAAAHWGIDTQHNKGVMVGAELWQIYNAGSTPWEVGNYFIARTAGYIVGGRIYKANSDTSKHHTIELWQLTGGSTWTQPQSGTQLASCRTGTETEGGYQSCMFPNRVAISAGIGHEYVILADVAGGGIYYGPDIVSPDQQFSNGTITAYFGTSMQGSGHQFPNSSGRHVSATYLYAVDPIFSASNGNSNARTLFPSSTLPGQQVTVYQQDWYTGLTDAQWSIVSGPGTITPCTDLWGFTGACYVAPWGREMTESVVIQAESRSDPAIKATATLGFTTPARAAK